MERTLRVLLQRNPTQDRHDQVALAGYEVLWPDGQPLSVGFSAFCKQGQRLLGLGRPLRGPHELLVDLICVPLADREQRMTRMAGHRVRRFCLRRSGRQARLHFLDGTPTAIVLDLDRDEPHVLHWVGVPALADGERLWFDLAARTVAEEPACAERGGASPNPPSSDARSRLV